MRTKGSAKVSPHPSAPIAERLPDDRSAATAHSLGERLARGLTDFTGSTGAFLLAACSIVVWAGVGPLFGFSQNWQLVINTGTTIVTFLMVFLIQRAQNKDALAIHLKLDELVAAHRGASNRLVSVEELPEEELAVLRDEYRRLMRMAARDEDQQAVRSIEECTPGGRANQPGANHSQSPRGRTRAGRISRTSH